LGGGDAGAAVAGAGRTGPGPPVPAGAMCHVPCTSTRDIKKKSPIVWNTTDNGGDRLAVRIGGLRQSSIYLSKDLWSSLLWEERNLAGRENGIGGQGFRWDTCCIRSGQVRGAIDQPSGGPRLTKSMMGSKQANPEDGGPTKIRAAVPFGDAIPEEHQRDLGARQGCRGKDTV